MRHLGYILFFVTILLFVSCAPEYYTEHSYGFISGIWHGFCFPFALIAKIIGRSAGLWAEHNNGIPYWVGYVIGLFWIGVPQWVRKRI